MIDFHISPTHPLAHLAAPEVRRLYEAGVETVAILGLSDPSSGRNETFCWVYETPEDWESGGYLWAFVRARD